MSEQLIPCPFCGCRGFTDHANENASCQNTDCFIWNRWMPIAAWNRRASPWVDPAEIIAHPEYKSDAMNIVELLVKVKGARNPTIGWWFGEIKEWRILGSPSAWECEKWMPIPEVL